MHTLMEVLEQLGHVPDRVTLETYIERTWIKPVKAQQGWSFAEVDISRIRLIHQLKHDMAVNDEAMDIVLHLLDQLYASREYMRKLKHSIDCQPRLVQNALYARAMEMNEDYTDV